jgi:hypothetical protein
MIKRIIIYLIILQTTIISSAQEVTRSLQGNSILRALNEKQNKSSRLSIADTLELPFFDDFSGVSVFPDTRKWSDNFVLINNTYSDQQTTTGIATFDALDNNGRLYETSSSSGFMADRLTSQPVNLKYASTANIWLSFYYQPGGLGDMPEKGDSLTLQFLAPEENKWYSVWAADNYTMNRFRLVMIKIDNLRFLKKGFRFRFTNYASLSPNLSDPSMVGNCDQWNLDYVLLNRNRNENDTVFADVAFRLPVRSLLKNHEAMPWKQYKIIFRQEMGSSIPIHYRNNDLITRNVTRNFEIWDLYRNSLSFSFSAGATNINPQTSVDYNANLIYAFNSDNPDSALFRITCSLKTDEFDPKPNDTIVYYQVFRNYFAFDDGSAESGYGINGLGSRNAMAAVRFKSYIQDTLRAIMICFNDSYLEANKRSFDLMVWDNNNGIPGNILFSMEEIMVEQGESINGFYTYKIPGGVAVNGDFFVGWKQRSETFLNAGLDINTPSAGRQFYWLNGEWKQSQAYGSLMIRPVVGNSVKITSIENIPSLNDKLVIWPNPSSDYININTGDLNGSGVFIRLIDLQGHELIRTRLSDRIDISGLKEGIYIMVTSVNGKPVSINRIIKSR